LKNVPTTTTSPLNSAVQRHAVFFDDIARRNITSNSLNGFISAKTPAFGDDFLDDANSPGRSNWQQFE
jgi:hypothetical protein